MKRRQRIQQRKNRDSKKAKKVSIAFRPVDNSTDVDTILSRTKLLQDVLGFSGDDVSKMFEKAMQLLHQHRYDEAITAFRFLTYVNPFICDFWIGLGAALQSQGAYKEALSNYLVAETMDPVRLDTYGYAIDVCLEMHDINQAKKVLQLGYAYAKSHSKDRASRELLLGLSGLKDRIMREEPSKCAVRSSGSR